jgi:hypothetical protein
MLGLVPERLMTCDDAFADSLLMSVAKPPQSRRIVSHRTASELANDMKV